MSNSTLDRTVSVVIALAALAVAASVVKRTFFPAALVADATGADVVRAAPIVDDWRAALEFGITIAGDSNAPVTLVEFSDLECPACRGFHDVLREVVGRRPTELRVVYVALPIPTHRFALPAARAMECADSLGRASAWVDAVYHAQDSIGLLTWGQLARRAGITDTVRILKCASERRSFARIDGGVALAGKHRISATPTFWINGIQVVGGIPEQRLDSIVARMVRDARH